jgi:acetyl esterase/lipase
MMGSSTETLSETNGAETKTRKSVVSRDGANLTNDVDNNNSGSTKVTTTNNKNTVMIQDTDGRTPPFVRCNSAEPFVNPMAPSEKKTPKEINQELNLNLGQSIIVPENTKLRKFLRILNDVFFTWYEDYVFFLWNKIPQSWRRKLTFVMWGIWVQLHKRLVGRRTAIHPDASEEYHALTTVMWAGRLFPVTIKRMRFSLSQLSTWTNTPLTAIRDYINQDYRPTTNVPKVQEEHCNVQAIYLHTQGEPTEKVIFWLYGGAFLSGDAEGNVGPAENVGRATGMDVFLPTYRLLPECTFDDMLWDVALAYGYLVKERKMDPSNIILLGISSGSGLVMRLLQFMAELKRGETLEPPYISPILAPDMMPSGAVLLCPFVDYTAPKGSFKEYDKHDLIVNQSVTEVGVPYFEKILGNDENRRRTSPVYRNMEGLPPLCVVVSEHEVVYDQTILLVNRAREAGVQVTVGMWKFMCHVFCFLASFVPEGQQSMDFVCDWIKNHSQANDNGAVVVAATDE